jgi:hypothetical protein
VLRTGSSLKAVTGVGSVGALVAAVAALLLTGTALAADEWVLPPDGQLTINGRGGPLVGDVGSFCTVSGCADQPWVTPDSGPSVAANAHMTFRLADASRVKQWTVYYADAAVLVDPNSSLLASGAKGSVKSFTFTGPPSGEWGMLVNVVSDDFDAGYFYRLHAGMPETHTGGPSELSAELPPELPIVLLLAGLIGTLVGWRLKPAPELVGRTYRGE